MKRTIFGIFIIFLFATTVRAQEFEIKSYDLNAKVDLTAQAVEVQAKLRIVNLSASDLLDKILLAGADKPRLTFILHAKAKINAMTISGNAVVPKTSEDARNNLLRVSTDITSAIASVKEFEFGINYTLPATDRTPFLRVSLSESYLLPPSFWAPVIHTPYGEHGADTAPYTITVTPPAGQKVISGGIRKSETSFEQSLADQPFFIVGDFDVVTKGTETSPIEVYTQRGLNDAGKQQVTRIATEAGRISTFAVKYFQQPASVPFRIISAAGFGATVVTGEGISQGRESNYATTGTLLIGDSFFRRDALDVGTIELMAGAAARAWIDGRVLLRGRGNGMLRDALPIYFAARYLGERSGPEQLQDAFDRYHRGYAPLARGSDGALLLISPVDRNYRTSMYNKGALVWRLFEKQLGQETFDRQIRTLLDRQRVDVLSLVEWKGPLCSVGRCLNVKALLAGSATDRKGFEEAFTQWVEMVVLPDFAVGQPQKSANGQESTIVNFGSGDFPAEVVATTAKGEKLRQTVKTKAGEFGAITYPANLEIVSIEVDPEKIYPQRDYANDYYPRRASSADLFGQANLALSKGDLAAAESKTREAIAASSSSPTLDAFLGRVLLAQKKNDEAAKTFAAVLKGELLTIQAYAWAHLGLGDLAIQNRNWTEAALHYRFVAATDLDPATMVAARNGLLNAEQEAKIIKISDDVRNYFKQFDSAILQGSAEAVYPLLDLGGMRRFAQSLVVRKPTAWQTDVLRVEEFDADRLAVDITLKLKIEGKDYSGKALFVLHKSGNKLLLSEVPIFDVK